MYIYIRCIYYSCKDCKTFIYNISVLYTLYMRRKLHVVIYVASVMHAGTDPIQGRKREPCTAIDGS